MASFSAASAPFGRLAGGTRTAAAFFHQALAKSFNSPLRSGTIACLKPGDNGLSEAHWYMNTIGAGWFDETWHPIFNNERGVRAIAALKDVTRSAQQGFAAAGNDECTVALQQDAATMGQQWATRARSVDDPRQSRVAGAGVVSGSTAAGTIVVSR